MCITVYVVIVLVELHILRFGLLQDGDVRISVFPQCEEIPVGGEGSGAGSIGCDSLVCPRLQRIRTRESEVRHCAGRAVNDDSVVVEDFLDFTPISRSKNSSLHGEPMWRENHANPTG